jgi:transcriptional regulator with XRE-family HTH domain
MEEMQARLIRDLEHLRQSQGLTKRRVERRLGVCHGYYNMFQKGSRRLQEKHLRAIARYFPELKEQVDVFLAFKLAESQQQRQLQGNSYLAKPGH